MTHSPLTNYYVNDIIEVVTEKYNINLGTPEYDKLVKYMYHRNNMQYSLTGWWEDDLAIAEDFVLDNII